MSLPRGPGSHRPALGGLEGSPTCAISSTSSSPVPAPGRVRRDQWLRLKKLLKHAYEHTEFYRRRFDRAGVVPEALKTWDDLLHIPVLTKDDIRASKEDMVADNITREKLRPRKTSGSTGVSLSFYVDEDSMQWKRGCALRHDHWAGWKLGEPWGPSGATRNTRSPGAAMCATSCWSASPTWTPCAWTTRPCSASTTGSGSRSPRCSSAMPTPCICSPTSSGRTGWTGSGPRASSPRPWSCTTSSARSSSRPSTAGSPTAMAARR